jgi:hypothetical protein
VHQSGPRLHRRVWGMAPMDRSPGSAEDDLMTDPTTSCSDHHRWSLVAPMIMALLLVGGCGPSGPPDPLSVRAVEARTAQVEQMRAALDEVVDLYGGEVLGESSVDECYEGQRNWKVDTGYDHRCSLLLGVLISVEGDFRTLMLDADDALEASAWESHGAWPGQLVDEYWDLRADESADGRVRLDQLPGPHSVGRNGLGLGLDYGSAADDRGLERIDRGQQSTLWCCGSPYFARRELIDVAQATETAHHHHLILITVDGHYLET